MWDEPEPELPSLADLAANPLGPLTARFANSEAVLRAHLETHSLEDWVREVMRLRDLMAKADANAVLTAAVLVRRLGGEVQVSDAELAAAKGRLVREPAPWGFTLKVPA